MFEKINPVLYKRKRTFSFSDSEEITQFVIEIFIRKTVVLYVFAIHIANVWFYTSNKKKTFGKLTI